MSTGPSTDAGAEPSQTPASAERLAVVGSGSIAGGLAATAAGRCADVVLIARSDASAERAAKAIGKLRGKLGQDPDDGAVRIVADRAALADATFVVEAIAEDADVKTALHRELGETVADDAVLATTTSSLSVEALAAASGRTERFCGLHVFNPVPRMALVELVHPAAATEETRQRARDLCAALGKTAVEVPDTPGFVVNKLLFPYLFTAVDLLEDTGLEPEAVDACMKLGAGHPMGPLALLDLVGLDVSLAIGEQIGATIPERVRTLVAEGRLGRKTGAGLYTY